MVAEQPKTVISPATYEYVTAQGGNGRVTASEVAKMIDTYDEARGVAAANRDRPANGGKPQHRGAGASNGDVKDRR